MIILFKIASSRSSSTPKISLVLRRMSKRTPLSFSHLSSLKSDRHKGEFIHGFGIQCHAQFFTGIKTISPIISIVSGKSIESISILSWKSTLAILFTSSRRSFRGRRDEQSSWNLSLFNYLHSVFS